LSAAGVEFELTDDFNRVVGEADAIYMTRIQDEWDKPGEDRPVDISRFCFTPAHLNGLRPDAILMHPLPRRHEIAVEVDNDPRAMYWRQARNGMWIRVALILNIFAKETEIHQYYADLVR
jgi:aspartate carbamoyltransferase catalytic subunit